MAYLNIECPMCFMLFTSGCAQSDMMLAGYCVNESSRATDTAVIKVDAVAKDPRLD
jgi:hypothetical protein